MSSWSHGYNVSTGYTFGFYRETAPDWIDLALAFRGLEPPRSRPGQAFRYCELGSGQGFGLCLLAAANPQGEFLGIDFSPEHTAHGTALAAELGLSNLTFVEGDFAALGAAWPDEYGQFDYVVMHGIYSWVPRAIREALIAILTASVRAGGAVYVSYNCQPGWVSTLPFQHLLRMIETREGLQGMAAIDAGRTLFAQLEAANSGVTRALPGLKDRIEATRKQPSAYLVQEYLHENWHPLWSSQVMTELGQAKLALSGSATIAENLLPGILPKPYQEVLAGHSDPELREDLTNCLINQTFRRDIFVRGPRRRFSGQRDWQEGFRFWRVQTAPLPEQIAIATAFGTVKPGANAFAPIIEALGESSLSLADLAEHPSLRSDPNALRQNLLLLLQAGWIGCGRQERVGDQAAVRCNAAVARLAGVGGPYRHVAAPSLGSALPASDTELLMCEGYVSDSDTFLEQPAAYLGRRLAELGRKLAKNGQPLAPDEEAKEIQRLADGFVSQTLPLWKRLGVLG